MKKLRPCKVWAIVDTNTPTLYDAKFRSTRRHAQRVIDDWGLDGHYVLACMLVPIEPKKRRVRK